IERSTTTRGGPGAGPRTICCRSARGKRRKLDYRRRVVEIVVPPLHERREDILPLPRQFLAEAARRFGKDTPAPAPGVAKPAAPVLLALECSRIGERARAAVVLARASHA